jgi:hypothetical protein
MAAPEGDLISARLRARLPWLLPGAIWFVWLGVQQNFAHDRAFAAAALWGLLIMASFVAWGATLCRLLPGLPRLDWALQGVIGMSFGMSFFAFLACFRLVGVATIVGFCALGPIVLGVLGAVRVTAAETQRRAGRFGLRARVTAALARPRALVFLVAVGVLYVMALLHYVGAVADTAYNVWDDEMAYRSFARQFLDTGTLMEPFSFRRVGSHGGQSLLHAMVLALASRDCLHVVDNGIAVLLLLGLIVGYRGGPTYATRGAILAAGLLAMALPHVPHNLGSEISGVVFFLALFRVIDDPRLEQAPARSTAILLGLIAAGVCTLRQTYMVAAAVFVGLAYLARVLYPAGRSRSERWRELFLVGAATLVFLFPWLVISARCLGTPLYPVIRGNLRPDFGMVGKVELGESLRWALANLLVFKPVTTIGVLFLAAVMLPFGRSSRALHALAGACVCAFALMMHFFQAFHESDSINRYYLAFTVAFCFAAVLRVVTEGARSTRATGAAAAAVLAVGVHFLSTKDAVLDLYFGRITAATEVLFARAGRTIIRPEFETVYRRLQAAVPAGAPLLVTLDHTYLLDGKRNTLYNYDHPGAIGPDGGPPDFKGPEAFASYLKRVGIRYIAFQVGPSSPEYSPAMWEQRRTLSLAPNGRGAFYQNQARFELDFFHTVTALEQTRRSLFHSGELHVLDLEARR